MTDRKKSVTNRLINEKSPYLQQHAYDPVNWSPWTEEAFERAKKEDKPVFLSIGYSTCHWCHVMEEESFSDPRLAEIVNAHYIPIIVDREERPDLDNLYMKAVIAMSGSGGWPLNLFLTHDKKPFYGGTYFPPEDKWGKTGLKKILASFSDLWKRNREEIINTAQIVVDEMVKQKRYEPGSKLDESIFQKAYQRLSSRFDGQFGGFGSGPKFPGSHILSFLLRYWNRTHEHQAMEMVEKTLMHMAQGGICDHIGGGFYRYAVDKQWRIPHFEKMLYDQALISKAYLEAYQATHIKVYGEIAKGILDYVLRDLRNPEGGFFDGEDADSALSPEKPEKKKEGAFYLFSTDEIINIVGKEQGKILEYYFGLDQAEEALVHLDKELRNKHILRIAHSLQDTAQHFNTTVHEIDRILGQAKQKLFSFRSQRPRPHLDNKILVDWNGLMISSLSLGARIFNEQRYKREAEKATGFILKNCVNDKGRLLHRFCGGEAAICGLIDDYAFFIQGLIDLYEATFNIEYLKKAKNFMDLMIELFWDEEEGGFFFVSREGPSLLLSQKEIYDGSIPSGNSVAALDILHLAKLLANKKIENKANSLFRVFSDKIFHMPDEHCQLLIALFYAFGPSQELVFAGNRDEEEFKAMISNCYQRFIPNKVIAYRPEAGRELDEVLDVMPLLKNQPPIEKHATAYVCKNYVCTYPAKNLEKLNELLAEV